MYRKTAKKKSITLVVVLKAKLLRFSAIIYLLFYYEIIHKVHNKNKRKK